MDQDQSTQTYRKLNPNSKKMDRNGSQFIPIWLYSFWFISIFCFVWFLGTSIHLAIQVVSSAAWSGPGCWPCREPAQPAAARRAAEACGWRRSCGERRSRAWSLGSWLDGRGEILGEISKQMAWLVWRDVFFQVWKTNFEMNCYSY